MGRENTDSCDLREYMSKIAHYSIIVGDRKFHIDPEFAPFIGMFANIAKLYMVSGMETDELSVDLKDMPNWEKDKHYIDNAIGAVVQMIPAFYAAFNAEPKRIHYCKCHTFERQIGNYALNLDKILALNTRNINAVHRAMAAKFNEIALVKLLKVAGIIGCDEMMCWLVIEFDSRLEFTDIDKRAARFGIDPTDPMNINHKLLLYGQDTNYNLQFGEYPAGLCGFDPERDGLKTA